MYDTEFAKDAFKILIRRLEQYPPKQLSKAFVLAFVRMTYELAFEDSPTEESYRQHLRLCAEHGFICLERYRRHGVAERQRT